jgi:hypothetical protein
MPTISLTEFVDFTIKPGSTRLTEVRRIKKAHTQGYDPAKDFYKKLRDGIVNLHREALPKSALDPLATQILDKNKQHTYPALMGAYKKFLGRKTCVWFDPASAEWSSGDLRVRANPELGLAINGVNYLIKLYFKDEPKLTKERIASISQIMRSVLGQNDRSAHLAILDVRRSNLHLLEQQSKDLQAYLEAEALAFCKMYDSL